MTSLSIFLGLTLLLILEGWLLLGIIGLPKGLLRLILSLPLATFTNTLIIFALTLFKIPLSSFSLLGLHLIIIIGLFLFEMKRGQYTRRSTDVLSGRLGEPLRTDAPVGRLYGAATALCAILLIITLIYSFSHSTILPTFHYDSATNWNGRAQISFYEQRIIFDDSNGLIAKPHYPFLYHGLQITTQQLQPQWNDRAANTIHFLFNLSALAALFLIIRKLRGNLASLIALTLIATTPLFAIHLGGSYADITLTLFALLSFGCFLLYQKSNEFKWILLSALFVAACVWTKSEGLPFCLIPWILMIITNTTKNQKLITYKVLPIALSLSLLWPILATIKGIPLSPHGSTDFALGIQEGAIPEAIKVIFTGGSIGPILPVALILILTNNQKLITKNLSLIIWPVASLILILAVYTLTSNAEYLLNGQSFDRQLLLPTGLLIIALMCNYKCNKTH